MNPADFEEILLKIVFCFPPQLLQFTKTLELFLQNSAKIEICRTP